MLQLLLIITGISTTLGTRTTLLQYQLGGVDTPFLVEYLYLSDCLGILLLAWLCIRGMITRIDWILPLVGVSILSILVWDDPYPLLSYSSVLRFGGIFLLARTLLRMQMTRWLLFGFGLGVISQSGIAVVQTLRQQSIGLSFLGESLFTPELSGRAKIEVLGRTLTRTPALYPHPNIYAAAALVVGFGTWSSQLKKSLPWVVFGSILLLMQIDHYMLSYVQGVWVFVMAVLVSLTPLSFRMPSNIRWSLLAIVTGVIILTGSKSVLALLIVIIVGYLTYFLSKKMFHVEHFQKPLLWISFPITAVTLLALVSLSSIIPQFATLQNRIFFVNQTLNIVSNQWITGVGLGQFVTGLPSDLPFWRYEPVHNIPLLLIAEIGILGGILWSVGIIWWLRSMMNTGYEK